MISIVRSLGAPVIEPAGKSARSAPTVRDVVAEPAADRRDQLVHGLVGLDLHQRRHLDRARPRRPSTGRCGAGRRSSGSRRGTSGRWPAAPASARRPPRVAPRGVVPLIGLVSSRRSAVDRGVALRASSCSSQAAPACAGGSPAYGAGLSVAEPEVGRHRVEVAGHRHPVGQVDLVGVAGPQLLLHPANAGGVLLRAPSTAGSTVAAERRPAARRPLRVLEDADVAWRASSTASGTGPPGPGGPAGRAGRRSRGSRPSDVRPASTGDLGLEHREDVVADDLAPCRRRDGAPRRRAAS